jgi:hypothetical protein
MFEMSKLTKKMGGTITQRNTAYKTGGSNAGENKNHQYRKMTVK